MFQGGRQDDPEGPSEDSDEGVVILMVDKGRSGIQTSEDADDLEGKENLILPPTGKNAHAISQI